MSGGSAQDGRFMVRQRLQGGAEDEYVLAVVYKGTSTNYFQAHRINISIKTVIGDDFGVGKPTQHKVTKDPATGVYFVNGKKFIESTTLDGVSLTLRTTWLAGSARLLLVHLANPGP
jgi:hypothetical protein